MKYVEKCGNGVITVKIGNYVLSSYYIQKNESNNWQKTVIIMMIN